MKEHLLVSKALPIFSISYYLCACSDLTLLYDAYNPKNGSYLAINGASAVFRIISRASETIAALRLTLCLFSWLDWLYWYNL